MEQLCIGDNLTSLEACIKMAQKEALLFMSKASFIKSKHGAGRKNSSLPSTAEGVLDAARNFSEAITRGNSVKFHFFGEHISAAIQTIKSFKRSK